MRVARSCARVIVRRGIIRPRLGWAFRASAGALSGAVGLHNVGNNSRLPGEVVWVCPPGEVQITVPTAIGLRYRLVLLLAGEAQIKLPASRFVTFSRSKWASARTMSRSTMS